MKESIHDEVPEPEGQPSRMRTASSRWTWIGWRPGKIARQRASDGALIGGLCTAGILLLLVLASELIFRDRPELFDPEQWCREVVAELGFAALAGAFLGSIGGYASRLPRKGLPVPIGIAIVAGFFVGTFVAIRLVIPFQKFENPDYWAVLAALVGGAVVAGIGYRRSDAASADPPSQSTGNGNE